MKNESKNFFLEVKEKRIEEIDLVLEKLNDI